MVTKQSSFRAIRLALCAAVVAATAFAAAAPAFAQTRELLNVSYDPTRELYSNYNTLFAAHWKAKTGQTVKVNQSDAGSGAQAQAVIDGLEADVVTLALGFDVDAVARNGKLIKGDWQARLPNGSAPYTSTIVFLVRKGNPKAIKDWGDLVKPGVQVITPNPKTSGGARWNYLAAYGYALKANNNDEAKAKAYLGALFKNVPVLDTGARGSTTTFTQKGIGDVLISWENEAFLALKELGADYQIVVSTFSILAIPPVAVVDTNVDKHKSRDLAEEHVAYLYSPEAQALIAKNFYRPFKPASAAQVDLARFPNIELTTIEKFGGWNQAQKDHFADGGVFDQIYQPAK